MTPQEKELITQLVERLKQAGNQPKDPEADALIRAAMREQPDAPYLLVQTVLIQDMALSRAQTRIAELERQLAGNGTAPGAPTSFLGAAAGPGSVPTSGPWQRAAAAPPPRPVGRPVWTQGSAPAPGGSAPPAGPAGWGPGGSGQGGSGQGGWGQGGWGPPLAPDGTSSFLRSAAATAAGVAGGALLFQGIQSMFGMGHAGAILGGMPMQPALNETVINNYYGDQYGAPPAGGAPWSAPDPLASDPGLSGPDPGLTSADADPGVFGPADDDATLADNQDLSSDFDPGGDFGGSDSDLV